MARITFRVNQEPPREAEDVTYYAFRPGYGREYIHPHTSLGAGEIVYEGESRQEAIREAMRAGGGRIIATWMVVDEAHDRYVAAYACIGTVGRPPKMA